jgi:hypothetical protein
VVLFGGAACAKTFRGSSAAALRKLAPASIKRRVIWLSIASPPDELAAVLSGGAASGRYCLLHFADIRNDLLTAHFAHEPSGKGARRKRADRSITSGFRFDNRWALAARPSPQYALYKATGEDSMVQFTINRRTASSDANATSLLWVIREELKLSGANSGAGPICAAHARTPARAHLKAN